MAVSTLVSSPLVYMVTESTNMFTSTSTNMFTTRKIISEMTYNVSMGTLNPTIPYYHLRWQSNTVIGYVMLNISLCMYVVF